MIGMNACGLRLPCVAAWVHQLTPAVRANHFLVGTWLEVTRFLYIFFHFQKNVFGGMQRQEDGYSRLKRVILIGDHHQLPPVVKNMAFQKYSHLDQSLFTRFIRLGTPYIQLNAQVTCCDSLGADVLLHCVCPAELQ